ncbi:MAG: hypothetical protein K2I91_00895, partial [Muribaculaceae bacterium]|nr:hypothetical protein [Muribaculaceae bacterium]
NHLPENGEVLYARGILALKRGDVAGAREFFSAARNEGVTEADSALQEVENYINRKGAVTIIE